VRIEHHTAALTCLRSLTTFLTTVVRPRRYAVGLRPSLDSRRTIAQIGLHSEGLWCQLPSVFAWNGSLNRSELEVQFLEAPEQEGAVPFEPTIACRTVLGL
jgi:hypothetical protein